MRSLAMRSLALKNLHCAATSMTSPRHTLLHTMGYTVGAHTLLCLQSLKVEWFVTEIENALPYRGVNHPVRHKLSIAPIGLRIGQRSIAPIVFLWRGRGGSDEVIPTIEPSIQCICRYFTSKKPTIYWSVRQILTTNELLHNGLLRGCMNVSCWTSGENLKKFLGRHSEPAFQSASRLRAGPEPQAIFGHIAHDHAVVPQEGRDKGHFQKACDAVGWESWYL